MTAFEAGLALLSVIIGGGIVGIPFAMFHTGIPFGIILNILVCLAGVYTVHLYLRTKDLSPVYVESLFELGFVTMGVSSIYLFSVLILLSGVGLLMLYFIVFSKISASLAKQIQDEGTDNIFSGRTIYIVVLAALLTPLTLKKMLKEMKFVSITLFLCIFLFLLLFIV